MAQKKVSKKGSEKKPRAVVVTKKEKRKRPPRKKVVGTNADKIYSDKKQKYFAEATRLLEKYDRALIVSCDNVQSFQMQQIRIALRGQAVVLMGKNTLLRKILKERANGGTERDRIMYEKIVGGNLLTLNVGFILTNGELNDIKKIVNANKIQAPARQGGIAPLDVVVPAGNTGLEPTKTSFFQALNIGTKITKGTVEILKDEKVLSKGDKVGNSEASLLQMLGIKPFFYGLELRQIYDQGSVYGPEVLELTDADMKKKFADGVSNVTALSLALGYTTKASFPHVMMNAFKKFLAVSITTDFTFTACGGDKLKEAIISGKFAASTAEAAPVAAATTAAPVEKAKVVEEEAEEEDMGFGLFD